MAEWGKISSLFRLEKVLRPEQFDATSMVTLPCFVSLRRLRCFFSAEKVGKAHKSGVRACARQHQQYNSASAIYRA